MDFVRINDHMITCLVSEHDMEAYDVTMEDLMRRSHHAMAFIHEVVKQAKDTVGYRPEGSLTSLQIAAIDHYGIAIMMAENGEEVIGNLFSYIKDNFSAIRKELADSGALELLEHPEDMAEASEEFEKALAEAIRVTASGQSSETGEHTRQMGSNQSKGAWQDEKAAEEDARRNSLNQRMFAFDSIREVFDYAKAVELPGYLHSHLYKDPDHGTYYLIIQRGDIMVQTMAGVYLTAYEYGHYVTDQVDKMECIVEHCDLIIGDVAIQKMKRKH